MKNYLLFIIISISLSLLIAFFLDWPRYQEFKDLETEIAEKREEIQSQEEYYKEVEKNANQLSQYQDALAIIESALPEDHSIPELLNFIQKTASQTGLIINQVAPFSITADTETEIEITRVNIDMEGDYSDLKEFLFIIERSARFIEVDKIAFAFPEEKEIFNFALTVTVYNYE